MNCRQVDKYLYDYCDNVLSPDQRVSFDQHLADCHSCHQAVDQALLETSILREEWDTPDLPADFTSRVMERIAAKPMPQAGSVAVDGKRQWQRRFIGIVAAAAVLLMVVYAPGMVKNEKIINVADREQATSESEGNEMKFKIPVSKQNKDFAVGGKGEVVGNSKEVYLRSANEEQSAVANQPSPAITPKNEPIVCGANDNSVSDNVIKKSLDQQSKEETMVATSVFPVQPANLPASYTIVDKVAVTGSCTYIFGTGIKEDQLTIKIAQLPLHTGQPGYSRSYVRPTSTADVNPKVNSTLAEPAGDESETEKIAVEDTENIEILNKEGVKTDIIATESSHTISYEVVHNNQTYLLTITANLSPEELAVLSQNLQLQSTTH